MKRLLFLIAVVLVGCGGTRTVIPPETTHTGKLRFIVSDPIEAYYVLETAPTKNYQLFFKRPVTIPATGSAVSVHGRVEGAAIRNATITTSVERAVKRTTALGTKKIAWIAFYYTGHAAPWTKLEIEHRTLLDEMSVKNFYEVESFTQLKVEGHVYGPYVVNTTPGCDAEKHPKGEGEATIKAEADGYTTSGAFTNVQYITPDEAEKCGAGGKGELPGSKSRVNIESMQGHRLGPPPGPEGEIPVEIMSHELGHNFGLVISNSGVWHTGSYRCSAGENMVAFSFNKIGGECKLAGTSLYDLMDPVSGPLNFTAALKQELGWWEASQVKEVTTSGNYTIHAAQNNEAGIHLLKIKRPSEQYQYYYVEFNEPGPEPFANWNRQEYPNTIYVGPVVELNGYNTLFLEPDSFVSPGCGNGCISTVAERKGATLPVGKTYEDTETHMKIKTESSGEHSTVVKVTFQGGAPEPPTFTGAKYLSEKQAGVEWERSPTATSYEVFRRPFGSTEFTKVAETTTALHVVNEVTPAGNNIWQYCVKAVNTAGKSECSSVSTAFLQSSSNGSLAGWVETSSAPVVGAKVSATFAGITLATWTGYRGYYRLDLPGGKTWKVTVSQAGYASSVGEEAITINKTTVFSPFLGTAGANSHADRLEITQANMEHEFNEAAALGVKNIRVGASWFGIEEKAGEAVEIEEGKKVPNNRLKRLDKLVELASAKGIKVDVTIVDTAPWSVGKTPGECESGGLECYAWSPTLASSAKPFAKLIAGRYKSKLAAIGIYNEPNVGFKANTAQGNYRTNTGAGFASMTALTKKYVEEANQIYEGAKEGYETVKVLGGESDNKEEFLTKMIAENVKMDGLGFHAYSENENGRPEAAASNSMKSKIVAAELLTPKPIWVNEWGYSTEHPWSEAIIAEDVQKSVALLNNTTFPHVEGWADYELRDQGTGSGSEEHFGLLKEDFTQKLSFTSFKEANK